MAKYNFGKAESDELLNLARTLGWLNYDKPIRYLDVIKGAQKKIFELTNMFTDQSLDRVISTLSESERAALKIASSYFEDGHIPEDIVVSLVNKGLIGVTGERYDLGNRVLDRLMAMRPPTTDLEADLQTANQIITEYNKLFGDLITAQKIKSEYKRMLKREMLERQLWKDNS